MSKARMRYGQFASRRGTSVLVPLEFAQSYPALAEFLGGSEAAEGVQKLFPHTLMVFAEGGRLKYCLTCSQTNFVGWGSISDPEKLLECIERDLNEDQTDWRERKGQR